VITASYDGITDSMIMRSVVTAPSSVRPDPRT
jgi:hypothetical protein